MTKIYCSICCQNGTKYCTYPANICINCCPKISVSLILEILDPTYHEVIGSRTTRNLSKKINKVIIGPNYSREYLSSHPRNLYSIIIDDLTFPIFWCTTDDKDMFQKCGVFINNGENNTITINSDVEKKIIIMEAYHNGQDGFITMKKMKQNFKRIRCGKYFYR